jgi:hypothetical protein
MHNTYLKSTYHMKKRMLNTTNPFPMSSWWQGNGKLNLLLNMKWLWRKKNINLEAQDEQTQMVKSI